MLPWSSNAHIRLERRSANESLVRSQTIASLYESWCVEEIRSASRFQEGCCSRSSTTSAGENQRYKIDACSSSRTRWPCFLSLSLSLSFLSCLHLSAFPYAAVLGACNLVQSWFVHSSMISLLCISWSPAVLCLTFQSVSSSSSQWSKQLLPWEGCSTSNPLSCWACQTYNCGWYFSFVCQLEHVNKVKEGRQHLKLPHGPQAWGQTTTPLQTNKKLERNWKTHNYTKLAKTTMYLFVWLVVWTPLWSNNRQQAAHLSG